MRSSRLAGQSMSRPELPDSRGGYEPKQWEQAAERLVARRDEPVPQFFFLGFWKPPGIFPYLGLSFPVGPAAVPLGSQNLEWEYWNIETWGALGYVPLL